MEKPTLVSRSKCYDGWVEFYRHPSVATQTEMKFSIFLPARAATEKLPVLYFLSGLTSTEENFMAKAGAQKYAAERDVILVCPDTSPRGAGVPGESDSWELGVGAGFYVNATQGKWAKHYRMFEYVADELPTILGEFFPVMPHVESITGFSMGGHGALVLALRQPGRYQSVSAFSPIAAPAQCRWGVNAFTEFLGPDRAAWAKYDANELVSTATVKQPILVDQGSADKFLAEQLRLDLFEETCRRVGYPATIRRREGYDHSFYFVGSFIAEHVEYHAKHLWSAVGKGV